MPGTIRMQFRWPRILARLLLAGLLSMLLVPGFSFRAPDVKADCALGSSCFQMDPTSGPSGSTVVVTTTIAPDCSPPNIQPHIELYIGDLGVGFGSADELTQLGEGTWQFTVPDLPPRTYKVAMFCVLEGDGPTKDTPTDATFRVTGAPNTDAAVVVRSDWSDPWPPVVALVSGLLAGVGVLRHLRRRRRALK